VAGIKDSSEGHFLVFGSIRLTSNSLTTRLVFVFVTSANQFRWEIIVQPVPRLIRNRIKQYILNSALPQILRWLAERAQLVQ
jgi:hypothetical protein